MVFLIIATEIRLIGGERVFIVWWWILAKAIRARYEDGVLKPLKRIEDLDEGEEVEIIIKHKVFTEEDYEEIMRILESIPKGRIDLLDVIEEFYYEEALH